MNVSGRSAALSDCYGADCHSGRAVDVSRRILAALPPEEGSTVECVDEE